MEEIEELIDEKINDWDDCLNRHYAGEMEDREVLIKAALSDMEQLKSSLSERKITYITDYAQQDGYVVMGIEPVEEDAE